MGMSDGLETIGKYTAGNLPRTRLISRQVWGEEAKEGKIVRGPSTAPKQVRLLRMTRFKKSLSRRV
jgi:hypothetical protein